MDIKGKIKMGKIDQGHEDENERREIQRLSGTGEEQGTLDSRRASCLRSGELLLAREGNNFGTSFESGIGNDFFCHRDPPLSIDPFSANNRIGVEGFEPTTSSSRTKRASQAALYPDGPSCYSGFRLISILFLFFLASFPCFAEETEKRNAEKSDNVCLTEHEWNGPNGKMPYTAEAGTLRVKARDNQLEGDLFYTAYFAKVALKEGERNRRPITFCFNGGPGSSSVWLHLGAFGPKRIAFPKDFFASWGNPQFIENKESLLEISDLVFIDPIPTGYSQGAVPEKEKQFYGFQEDVGVMGEFIRSFLTRYSVWERPKFLAGESYGGTRAVALATDLESKHFIHLDGMLLIAPALDFATFSESGKTHLLPYLAYLPTYAAIAQFHKKAFVGQTLEKAVDTADNASFELLAPLLLRGDSYYSSEKKEAFLQEFQAITGLKPEVFLLYDFQVGPLEFAKELLRDRGKITGRFDGRLTGDSWMPAMPQVFYDPSLERVASLFTKYMNDYLKRDLKVNKEEEYRILLTLRPWSFGERAQNQFLSVQPQFEEILVKNPRLQTYIASGYYDLAIPFGATNYFLRHLRIPDHQNDRIEHRIYPSGHMMYLDEDVLKEMKDHLRLFYAKALKDPSSSGEPSLPDPQSRQTPSKK